MTEAEALLKHHFAQTSVNFLEQNSKIFEKQADRILIKFNEGYAMLNQAEQEVMMQIYRLNQELAKIRTKKTELERAKEFAMKEARLAREESAKDFLVKQEEVVKVAIDKQLKHLGR